MASIIGKALRNLTSQPQRVQKAGARGTLSSYTVGINPIYGQPLPTMASADAQGQITPERMREVVMKTATAGASMNAILDYAGAVDLKLRNRDASQPVPKKQFKIINKLFQSPNPTQTARQFKLALMRDIFTFGFGAIEIEFDEAHEVPVHLWVMDAARLKVDYDEHGNIKGYDMLDAHGNPVLRNRTMSSSAALYEFPQTGQGMGVDSAMPGHVSEEHGWSPDEVIFFNLNPMSNSVYPSSRIVQLFTNAVIEDLMMHFIATRFTDSNVPFGIMDLGEVTEPELKIAIENWNAQAQEQHRILLTGSKGGAKWIPFGYHLKELEATGLLAEVRGKIMAILGVTMNELGESQDINKSNGYNLSFTFKKRAIEPMLNEVSQTLTKRLLWDTYGFEDLEMYYEEIDSRDELLQAQIDDLYMKMGVETINNVLNRRGKPSVKGGEVNRIFTGSAWLPIPLVDELAQGLVDAEQAGAQLSMNGPDAADNARFKTGGQQGDSPAKGAGPNGGNTKPDGAAHAQRAISGVH